MGLVAGLRAVNYRIMGHAGALVQHPQASAAAKINALEAAGVVMIDHPAKFGEGMKKLLHVGNKASITVSPKPILIVTYL